MPGLPDYLDGLDLNIIGPALEGVRHARHPLGDGGALHVYECGDEANDTLVLLPPYGVTYLLVARLARILAQHFHVLSWESKGCPDTALPLDDGDLALTQQAACLRGVLTLRGVERFHFVGWCQAAQLAVHLIAVDGVVPTTVSWIAPAGLGCSVLKSEFDRCALPIYRDIAQRGVEHAAMLSTILDKYRNEPLSAGIAAEKLTMLHLAASTTTLRFARYMELYEDNRQGCHALLDKALATQPVLAIHCKDDTFSHYSESVQLAKRSPHVRLRLLDHGGHLQVFNNPEIAAEIITGFIADSRESTAARLTPAV